MPRTIKHEQLMPGLHRFADTCNVYVVADDTVNESIAIDFGSGDWLAKARSLGLPPVKRLFITHHHADQCAGLASKRTWPFEIHAPAGAQQLIEPDGVKQYWKTRRANGVPAGYDVLERGIDNVRFDLAGFTDQFWHTRRIRFLDTPGHGRRAVSVIIDMPHEGSGKQVVFCGDAAHDGATVHKPYQLEWDHWTGEGALAAWQGVQRLHSIAIDMLCPSHGPVVRDRPRGMLAQLAKKLLAMVDVKGSVCTGEADHYLPPTHLACGAKQLLPSVYQFGGNGYLVVSPDRTGLVIDPYIPDLRRLDPLLDELRGRIGDVRVTDATSTHYHSDHVDGMPTLRRTHKVTTWLHPRVAAPLETIGKLDVPWLVSKPIKPDKLLPRDGTWQWGGSTWRVAPFAGQTWWHCVLMAEIDGKRVMFAGDNYQPATRWNGTGGFCAFNGSRFAEGFVKSAQLALDWKPDILCNGHSTYQTFHASQFKRIIKWARRAEQAMTALCPSGDLEKDYYLHPAKG